MYITGHMAMGFIAAKSLGLGDTESLVVAGSGGANDLLSVVDWLRRKLFRDGDQSLYGSVYRALHSYATWMIIPFIVGLGVSYWFHCHTPLLSVAAFMAHIAIDDVWHKPSGGWYAWGAPTDVVLHVLWWFTIHGIVKGTVL